MRVTVFSLVAGLIAVFVAITAVLDRRAARNELAALGEHARQAGDHLLRLETENATLRKENAALSSQLPNPRELAKLRAEAAELRRLRAQSSSLTPRGQNPKPADLSSPPPPVGDNAEPLTLDGTVRLNFGETIVSGGWLSQTAGKRTFALLTPTRLDDGHVMVAARLAEIPETALEMLGLKELNTEVRAAERYSTLSREAGAELVRALAQTTAVDVLTSPTIVTRSGSEATISIGGQPDAAGISITLTPQVQPGGTSLDMRMKVVLLPPPPAAKAAP